jgi:2-polyprenyl-3-methyl-5-hydroxy-6-metoxy-1,4-benzoquinol methylase
MTITRPCIFCESVTPHRLVYGKTSENRPKRYRITEEDHTTCWDIVRCTQCGMLCSDWKIQVTDIDQLYSQMEDELYDEEQKMRRLTFRRDLGLIQHYAGKIGRILDIGCSTGGLLLEAKDLGWQTAGIDLSHWAVEKCKQHGLTGVHEGTIQTYPGEQASTDVVTMLDYIEHDPDIGHTLDAVSHLLCQNGILYVTTPDSGSLVAKLFGRRWWGINALHLTLFSRSTIKKLLEKHGFEVLIIRSYSRVFTWGYWGSRLEHFGKPVARIVLAILRFVRLEHVPLTLNLGDMMEVVARKK